MAAKVAKETKRAEKETVSGTGLRDVCIINFRGTSHGAFSCFTGRGGFVRSECSLRDFGGRSESPSEKHHKANILNFDLGN